MFFDGHEIFRTLEHPQRLPIQIRVLYCRCDRLPPSMATDSDAASLLLRRLRTDAHKGWDIDALFSDTDGRFARYKRYKTDGTMTNLSVLEQMLAAESRRPSVIKHALAALGKRRDELRRERPLIPYETHVVFGSPDSTDIDVAYCTHRDEWSDLQQCRIDEQALHDALCASGYDLETRSVDTNIVIIDSKGDVKRTSKGSCYDTQNMLYYTHQYHAQSPGRPMPIERAIDVSDFDVQDKCRGVVKCFLDHLKPLVGEDRYAAVRNDKKKVYEQGGLLVRARFVAQMVPYVLLDQQTDCAPWADAMKTLHMKLAQMVLLEHDQLEYNKRLLPEKTHALLPTVSVDQMRWYLTRGTEGDRGTGACFAVLMEQFSSIVERECGDSETAWHTVPISTETNWLASRYMGAFWHLFVKTPNEPSHDLVASFIEHHPQLHAHRTLNAIFAMPSDCTALPSQLIDQHVQREAQRSDAWRQLLEFYRCGRNTGVPPLPNDCTTTHEYVTFYWHLVRGALAEMVVQNALRPESIGLSDGYRKATVGLLVERKGTKGSLGIAPDLLLVSRDGSTVVPVEIKCLPHAMEQQNHDVRRAVRTARKQLQTAARILGSAPCTVTADRGIVILACMTPGAITAHYATFALKRVV